jgi:uncharacterized membrane protein YjfL (UPF0719 family)
MQPVTALSIVNDVRILILSLVYAVVGMVLLYLGYRIFDWLTPSDMQKKIFEEGNTAVAITVGLFILGLAVVIGAAIHG